MTPHVVCVCLTADRQAYTDRAVALFLAQSYVEKTLLIVDNGKVPYQLPFQHPSIKVCGVIMEPKSIGALRNLANRWASADDLNADIIAHWDSDDYSHPLRLAWQVQRLKAGKLKAVGYKSMLFWRKERVVNSPRLMSAAALDAGATSEVLPGEAWLFTHDNPGYGFGTSLTYWAHVWQEKRFKELNIGEDLDWLREQVGYGNTEGVDGFFKGEPAMVAELHEGNTTKQDFTAESWKRVPDWDDKLRKLMKL